MKGNKKVVWLIVLVLAALPATVALAAKAPVNLSGTTWAFNAQVKMKVKKLGGYKDMENLVLYFGPNTNEQLSADGFELKDITTGDAYFGNWADPKANGKVTLEGNTLSLEKGLGYAVANALENVYTTVADVQVTLTKQKVKCTVKPGKGAKLSLKAAFTISATLDGVPMQTKGSFAVKAKGTQPS